MTSFCYNVYKMTSINNCEVCTALSTNEPIFETNSWAISLSPDQGYLGRCYVTLKEHKAGMADLTNNEWLEFADIVKRLEGGVRGAFGAKLFNWVCLMNNAFQVSPALPHVHWHVRPRYEKSVNFEGEGFVDPMFGYHYDRNQSKLVNEDVLNRIKGKIKANL